MNRCTYLDEILRERVTASRILLNVKVKGQGHVGFCAFFFVCTIPAGST